MHRGGLVAGLLSTLWVAAAAPAQGDTLAVARLLVGSATPSDGDVDARCAAMVAGAVEHGRSPASAALAQACHPLVPQLRDPTAFAALLQPLAARDDLHGTLKSALVGLYAATLERLGRADESAAVLLASGFPEALLVLGPFGDDGDNYLGKPYPPELGLGQVDELAGRFGPVRPRVAHFDPSLRHGGYALRSRRTGHVGCFYAVHQPSLANAAACYLELFAPGSFEVFVNGSSAGRFSGFADPYNGWHWLPIVLRKGTNHVLVKTALNGFDQIVLRYVDGAGRPIAWTGPTDPARIVPTPTAGDDAPPLPPAFVTPVLALDRAARTAHGDDAVVLHLATALAAAPDSGDALVLEHVLAAEAAAPTDVGLRLGLAAAFGQADLLPEEVRRSRARSVLDAVRAQTESHAWAVEQYAQHLADEDKYEDAIRLLQATVDAKQAGPSMFARLHGFYERLEFRAEATRLRARWLELYPGDSTAADNEAEERQRDGDVLGARDVLEGARAVARGDGRVNQRLLNLAVDQGDSALALRLVADIYRGREDGADAARTLAEVRTRLGNRAEAVRAWQKLAAHAEASARDLVRAGNALLDADADQEAQRVLQAALTLDPSQEATRMLLRRLSGSSDHPDLVPFRRDTAPLIAAFQAGEAEKGASSTLLLDQMIVELFEDGSSVEETHQVRRINDLSGVDKFQEANDAARADEVVTLCTVAGDGHRYVPHRVSGKFSMPRLAPGAFVEQVYRTYKDAPGAAPWRGPEFHFQSSDEPYQVSELVLILPKDAPGSFRVRNFDGTPEVRALPDGKTAYVYARHDIPRLTPERLAPPMEEIVPLVAWGEDRASGTAARRAYDYFLYRVRGSTLVTEKARELTQGMSTVGDKLRAIHAFVHETIPTSRGEGSPTAVLLRRQGPRFWLEIALLRAAEIPLQLATAARTVDAMSSEPAPLFAGEATYGVDAARIDVEGEEVWLFQDDPRYWPLGRVPSERMGAPALLLAENGWTSTTVTAGDPSDAEGVQVKGEVVLDDKGTATFTAEGTLRGRDGFAAGDQLREREDAIKKLAARQVAAQILEGWSPRSVELVLAAKDQPLGLKGVLNKRRAVSAAGEVSLLDLPVSPRSWLKALGDRAERKQQLALTGLSAQAWEVAIDPGQAFRFVEIPADVLVRHPLIDYAQTFRLVGGKLVIRRQWTQRPGRLDASLFGEWLDLLRRLDLAEETKIKLAAR
ncbi:MAG: hypothetical protein R3F56_17175 [Planctomycetota bacterium]